MQLLDRHYMGTRYFWFCILMVIFSCSKALHVFRTLKLKFVNQSEKLGKTAHLCVLIFAGYVQKL